MASNQSDLATDFAANLQSEHSPWRIGLGAFCALVLALAFDFAVYRGYGPTGWAVFFVVSILVYSISTAGKAAHKSFLLIGAMILLLALRLISCGTGWQVFIGLLSLPIYALTLHGHLPDAINVILFSFQSLFAAFFSLGQAIMQVPYSKISKLPNIALSVVLPTMAVMIFGTIFVLANPDLQNWTIDWISNNWEWLAEYLRQVNQEEIFIVIIVFWLVAGQLLPILSLTVTFADKLRDYFPTPEEAEQQPSDLYAPYRNTLIAVIVLFVVYLIFEFRTLWFREFPVGFYYAGYAHQGAAWLTFALALATVMLSVIFQAPVLADPRIRQLKKLAWIWSALNFVLALAVYNRMWIYIGFNGMTRMRVLGLYGITTVIGGFVLVVWKIRNEQGFVWLVQRQIWTFVLAVYLLTVTPVDYLIHTYNTRQILAGNLAPSVQITEHPVSAEGWLALTPLIHCEDEIIREGMRSKLAEFYRSDSRLYQSGIRRWEEDPEHWTAYQVSIAKLKAALQKENSVFQDIPRTKGNQPWQQFKDYAYQWY